MLFLVVFQFKVAIKKNYIITCNKCNNKATLNSHRMDDAILIIYISLRYVKLNFNTYFSIELGLPNK